MGDGRRSGRWLRLALWLVGVAAVAWLLGLVFDLPFFTAVGALVLGSVIFRAGWFFLQSMATPPPPPPDPGTLRRVKLVYRCNVCGAEVRMTAASSEDPEPPRHCMDEMALVSPVE
jgi:hypothetical protein